MFRLKSSIGTDNKVFIQRECFSLAIIFFLVVLGNRISSVSVLILAAAVISFCILRSDVPNAFCWALFLVPNIRMLDRTGISFIVNAMMALPLVVYFFRTGLKKISAVALLGSFALGIMELLHDAVLFDFGNAITIIGWSLNLFLCILVTTDSRVNISRNDIFSALSTGIIMSALMYLSVGTTSVMRILETLNSGARFSAFADDPNYYSLYICLTIACILNVTGKNVYKFCVMILLVGIGFLTASKMCMLLMAFEFTLILLQLFSTNKNNRADKKFILVSAIGLVSILVAFRDYVRIFMTNFIRRMGDININSWNLERLTSGRSVIIFEYLEILYNNLICLMLGYGFNYHLFLGQSSGKGAHNTYLDLLLAWGIIGTIVFIITIYYWVKAYKSSRKIQNVKFVQHLPMIVLLINYLDLSCLSASMFPFTIAVGLIQQLPGIANWTGNSVRR